MRSIFLIINIFFLLIFLSAPVSAFRPAYINAPAVILQNNSGTLTKIGLNITKGDGNVMILGVPSVGNSTLESAKIAVKYASNYTLTNYSKYNFTYTIFDQNTSVSGPSAGAAMTILAISVLSNKTLRPNFTMTGTISLNGTIGPIGGVYDKASAAHSLHLNLFLVPKVPITSSEDELYFLIQTAFNLPLVQVANISQAAGYAFSNVSVLNNETHYNFYINYTANKLNSANITCSNNCNESLFRQFSNFTLNLTQNEINNLSSEKNFSNVSQQLNKVLSQSKQISDKGYLYTGDDFAFLDYLNAFYFNHAYTTKQQGLNTLYSIQGNCTGLIAPQLTFNNFDFVLNGELRQVWAEYTINQTIKNYNASAVDTDGVLFSLYSGGEANAWCNAAKFIYSKENNTNNSFVLISNLSSIAQQKISNASSYPGIYLTTAQQAYKNKNYALAILDAGYANAIGSAANKFNLNASSLNNMTSLILLNKKFYGSFATNFANQAEFYLQESKLTTNATLIHQYSYQAYSSALLADQISNNIVLIHQNLQINQTAIIQNKFFNSISQKLNEITILLFILVFLISIITIVLILIFLMQSNSLKHQRHIIHKK